VIKFFFSFNNFYFIEKLHVSIIVLVRVGVTNRGRCGGSQTSGLPLVLNILKLQKGAGVSGVMPSV
jgi:hypothetical protein